MSIWKFLGLETNHKRIAKYNQKAIDHQNVQIKSCCNTIMLEGIKYALKYKDNELVVAVLKKWPEPPNFYHYKMSDRLIKNWKEAQEWLYAQEHPNLSQTQKDLEEMKKKMQEMEQKITEYEKNK